MGAAMMVLPVSQADAGLKLPGVKINLTGNNKGPAPTTPPVKAANSISGKNETLREIFEDHRR